MATWVLKFISGKYQGQEFTLQPGEDYTVGRSGDSSLILVEDMVSRNHAHLFIDDSGGVRLEDLGSTNGSFVNGERVRDANLKDGDRVLFGTSIIKLVRIDDEQVETGTMPRPEGQGPPRLGAADAAVPRASNPPATMAMQAIVVPPAGTFVSPPAEPVAPTTAPPAPAAPPPPPMAPPTHVSRPTVATAIAGMLEEVALGDLLQLFSSSRKNGVLRVDGANNGAVHLREGRIVFAEITGKPDLHPEKAAYRILTWETGNFVLEPPEAGREFSEELEFGTEGLLMESMRLLDEMENLRGKLPHDAMVAIKRPVVPPLRSLTPELLDTLQLVINSGHVEQILDRSLASDLETMQDLGYLLKHGYVEQVFG